MRKEYRIELDSTDPGHVEEVFESIKEDWGEEAHALVCSQFQQEILPQIMLRSMLTGQPPAGVSIVMDDTIPATLTPEQISMN